MFIQFFKRVITPFNLVIPVTRNKRKYRIPVIKKIGSPNLHDTEKWMYHLLGRLLKNNGQNDIFVDVGVNVGQTLLKFRSVNNDMEYYGFEPNQICCFYVEELIRINNIRNCTVFPVALGEQTGITQLFIHDSDDSAGSSATTLADFKDAPISITKTIPVFPLAYFQETFWKGKNVKVVKIDVEGAELEVLKGAVGLLQENKPLVIIELLPSINARTKMQTITKKREIQRLLEGLNYSIYKINKDASGNFSNLTQIEDISNDDAINCTEWDYIFIENTQVDSPAVRPFLAS